MATLDRDRRNFRAIGLLIVVWGIVSALGSLAIATNAELTDSHTERLWLASFAATCGVGQIASGVGLRKLSRSAIWPAILFCLPGPGLLFSLILLLRNRSYTRLVQAKSTQAAF